MITPRWGSLSMGYNKPRASLVAFDVRTFGAQNCRFYPYFFILSVQPRKTGGLMNLVKCSWKYSQMMSQGII